MPIYTYECQDCKHKFDEIQKCGVFVTRCPHCFGEAYKHSDSFLSSSVGLPNGFASTRAPERGGR